MKAVDTERVRGCDIPERRQVLYRVWRRRYPQRWANRIDIVTFTLSLSPPPLCFPPSLGEPSKETEAIQGGMLGAASAGVDRILYS